MRKAHLKITRAQSHRVAATCRCRPTINAPPEKIWFGSSPRARAPIHHHRQDHHGRRVFAVKVIPQAPAERQTTNLGGQEFESLRVRAADYVDKILSFTRDEASRHPGRAADKVRAGYQPANREGARPRSAADPSRPRRRGDRIRRSFIAAHLIRYWHKCDSRDVRFAAALGA